tara:strand:- start:249 stop:473 length:225 start_codon:yes stop_codon:yes gene_type:complete
MTKAKAVESINKFGPQRDSKGHYWFEYVGKNVQANAEQISKNIRKNAEQISANIQANAQSVGNNMKAYLNRKLK